MKLLPSRYWPRRRHQAADASHVGYCEVGVSHLHVTESTDLT